MILFKKLDALFERDQIQYYGADITDVQRDNYILEFEGIQIFINALVTMDEVDLFPIADLTAVRVAFDFEIAKEIIQNIIDRRDSFN